MRIHILICTFLTLSFFSTAQEAYAKLEDPAALINSLKLISENTRTVQCDFVQEKELSFMTSKMVSRGTLYFSGSDQLRWEYTTPYSYVVLMVDGKLVVVDEGQVNETKLGSNPAFKKVQELLTNTLTGDFLSQETSFNQTFAENEQYYRIEMVPVEKELARFVSRMAIYFSKKDMMLRQFEMDENGDMTRTIFSNQKINEILPTGIFKWN